MSRAEILTLERQKNCGFKGTYLKNGPENNIPTYSYHSMTDEERACLQERKYWAFLLSSIVTFCVLMLLVVAMKMVQSICWTNAKQKELEQRCKDNSP